MVLNGGNIVEMTFEKFLNSKDRRCTAIGLFLLQFKNLGVNRSSVYGARSELSIFDESFLIYIRIDQSQALKETHSYIRQMNDRDDSDVMSHGRDSRVIVIWHGHHS